MSVLTAERTEAGRYEAWRAIKLGQEEHGFICGQTGCGKTELARRLIEDPWKPESVVYDAKHSRNISGWVESGHKIFYDFDQLIENEWAGDKRARRVIYQPSLEEAEDPEAQDIFFRWIYRRKRTRIFVDECSALLGESRPSKYLKGCLTRGRELGISTVCATQRPASIPIITMSEARKVYIFFLFVYEDRERLRRLTGISEDDQFDLQKHEFFIFDTDLGVLTHDGWRRRLAPGQKPRRLTLDLE